MKGNREPVYRKTAFIVYLCNRLRVISKVANATAEVGNKLLVKMPVIVTWVITVNRMMILNPPDFVSSVLIADLVIRGET